MLIGSRDARPAALRGSQADTASSAASVGPSLEAFSLTRKQPAGGGVGVGASCLTPSLSPPPLPFFFTAMMMMMMRMMMMILGKEAALGCGLEGEDGRIRGILCIFVTTWPRVRPSTALHLSVLIAGMGKVMLPWGGWGQPRVRAWICL